MRATFQARRGGCTPQGGAGVLGTWGATVRMSGHRRRSGVKSMGRKAGSPAVTLAVTTPMHRARPSSTAHSVWQSCQLVVRLACCCELCSEGSFMRLPSVSSDCVEVVQGPYGNHPVALALGSC